jgi:threonine synthase
MNLYSTKNKATKYSLREAVLQGLPADNGLFMPEVFPKLSQQFYNDLSSKSFAEMSFDVARSLIGDEIPETDLKALVYDAINFEAPLVQLNEQTFILELFHGPTLAFKDFGARFMSRLVAYYIKNESKKTTILVATSGDTGSAVASGFYDVEGIDVVILYPSGKVSPLQEKQLTTLDKNISAIEIKGTFDDCQRLVKQAFLDNDLRNALTLSSANSINIARLIPQSFYYFYAFAQLNENKPVLFSVPSGNFGNLTAGIFAKKMGLPVERFIAATNQNKIVPDYLSNGIFEPKASVQTISNAMDVGNPSNFMRMMDFYPAIENMQNDIAGFAFTDDETKMEMRKISQQYNYITDPHGAVGLLGLEKYLSENSTTAKGIVLGTAHPAKFIEVVEEALAIEIPLPHQLAALVSKTKNALLMESDFNEFKSYLLSRN